MLPAPARRLAEEGVAVSRALRAPGALVATGALAFALACALAIGLTACTAGGPEQRTVAWSEIALPADFSAAHLVTVGGDVIVGGNVGEAPRLLRVATGGQGGEVAEVAVSPVSFYGRIALWRGFAVDGDRLLALGGRTGGGHGNPRWSTWEGDPRGPGGLIEQDAPAMEVFGGWRGGGLAQIVSLPGEPVIVGARAGDEPGLDIAVWVRQGGVWVAQDSSGTALAAQPGLLPGVTNAAADGDRLVITGYVQYLGGGTVRMQAAVWTGTPGGAWDRIDLPASTAESTADAIACSAGTCLVVGRGDDRVLAWRLAGDGVHSVAVPDATAGGLALAAPVAGSDGFVAAVPGDGGTRVLLVPGDASDQLVQIAGPVGSPLATAVVDGTCYVLTSVDGAARLWSGALDSR